LKGGVHGMADIMVRGGFDETALIPRLFRAMAQRFVREIELIRPKGTGAIAQPISPHDNRET